MKTILMQGDSITDASRSREWDGNPGHGYPTLVASALEYNYPGKVKVINRGVSGDRIVDIYARIKKDIINIAPDYMSILIGVNDVWHEFMFQNGVSAFKFEKVYSDVISEIKEALPDIGIVILEPFVLKGEATEKDFDEFEKEVKLRAAASKRIAEKFSLPFVYLQKKFDEALLKAPADWWLGDGVHPTAAGHSIIAKELVPVFEKLIEE